MIFIDVWKYIEYEIVKVPGDCSWRTQTYARCCVIFNVELIGSVGRVLDWELKGS